MEFQSEHGDPAMGRSWFGLYSIYQHPLPNPRRIEHGGRDEHPRTAYIRRLEGPARSGVLITPMVLVAACVDVVSAHSLGGASQTHRSPHDVISFLFYCLVNLSIVIALWWAGRSGRGHASRWLVGPVLVVAGLVTTFPYHCGRTGLGNRSSCRNVVLSYSLEVPSWLPMSPSVISNAAMYFALGLSVLASVVGLIGLRSARR